jgi:hypothetical protein
MLNGTNSYKVVELNSTELAVGTPFFVQTPAAGSVTVRPTADISYAPARRSAPSRLDACAVTFAAASAPLRTDRIFISASEDALDDYELGRDLVKMAASTPLPELWINAYGKRLSVNNAPLYGAEEVAFPLSLSAPAEGDYILKMESAPDNAEIYLMYNGRPVWNLAVSPCTLSLPKGVAEGYSLLLHACAPRISTDSEQTDGQTVDVQKFVRNGMLYILRDGILYDATGRKVE